MVHRVADLPRVGGVTAPRLGPVRHLPIERDRVARALDAVCTRLPPPNPDTVERLLTYFRDAASAASGTGPDRQTDAHEAKPADTPPASQSPSRAAASAPSPTPG